MSLPNYSHTEPDNRASAVHCFSVRAMADPGMMLRLMELWAKRGLVPDRWHGATSGGSEALIDVDIESSDIDRARASQMAEAMRAMFGVSHVLLSEKRISARV